MIRMMLAASVIHPSWDKPVAHSQLLFGRTKSDIMDQIKLGGRQLCQLKSWGRTTWTDHRGAIHTLILKEVPIEIETQPKPTFFQRIRRFFHALYRPQSTGKPGRDHANRNHGFFRWYANGR